MKSSARSLNRLRDPEVHLQNSKKFCKGCRIFAITLKCTLFKELPLWTEHSRTSLLKTTRYFFFKFWEIFFLKNSKRCREGNERIGTITLIMVIGKEQQHIAGQVRGVVLLPAGLHLRLPDRDHRLLREVSCCCCCWCCRCCCCRCCTWSNSFSFCSCCCFCFFRSHCFLLLMLLLPLLFFFLQLFL